MTQTAIRSAITPLLPGMTGEAWLADETMRGEKTLLFRAYMDGDHRANMTSEMRRMLNISSTGSLNELNKNYCPVVVSTLNDRITLSRVEGDTPAMTEWCAGVSRDNRLTALQGRVHEAALRDGRTFVMVDVTEGMDGARRVRFTHEPAFDGTYGVLPHFATDADRTPDFALKVWRLSRLRRADTTRVNVYLPDRILRFITLGAESQTLIPFAEDGQPDIIPWTRTGREGGEPLGVPLVMLVNQGAAYSNDGRSALEDVVPLQDIVNRNLYSTVMTAELTGFNIRLAVGFSAPSAVTPGMILSVYPRDATGAAAMAASDTVMNWLKSVRLEQLPVGDLTALLEQGRQAKQDIFDITNTPDDAAPDASGESQKQRETKLLAKVRRFQADNGAAWEDAFALGARAARAFSATVPAPAYEQLTARWGEAETRNDSQVVQDALAQFEKGAIDHQTYLELVAPVYGWDADKIARIAGAVAKDREATTRAAVRGFAEGLNMGAGEADTNTDEADEADVMPDAPAEAARASMGMTNGTGAAHGGA